MIELAWGLFGGACAVAVEVIFKRHPEVSWWPTLWLATLPMQAGINLAIWQILRSDSLLGVAIWFGASTAVLRLLAVGLVGGTIGTLTWVAYALTLSALVVKLTERAWVQ